MSTSLMTARRFAPLFWCQFFSAFGDNFLKTALVFLILFHIAGGNSEALITLAGATLILPFFFLSGIGGELADRFDKALVAQRLKLVEIGVAALAVAGFAFHSIDAVVHRRWHVRDDRFAVRTDQIRHPARPPQTARN